MTKWEQLQKQMQAILSKEIALRQELLAVMHQQEHLLVTREVEPQEELRAVCHGLVKGLKHVTKARLSVTHQLFQRLYSTPTGLLLNQCLNPLVDIEAETLLLYQKTRSLIDKIHGQHLRNKNLQEMILQEGPLYMCHNPFSSEITQTKEKKKTLLLTVEYYSVEKPH